MLAYYFGYDKVCTDVLIRRPFLRSSEVVMAGLYFEQLTMGQVFRHDIRRTVTETDNILFTTMTHNPAAIHLDAHYAKDTEFGRPLMNSVFTLGLVVGISVGDTTLGTTVGNLGWDEVRFPKPVFIGDTIRVESTVIDTRESKSRPANGIVVFEHVGYNQHDELVCSCKRSALMYRLPSGAN
ncbi:MaoC family dehydratase [Pseudomonas sp. BF-R-01]|jgi:acyl dehydratase|uniref:MaoC family dehydratase n=1 Tax=Pseudomonas sp. BF-R-01 TaxID=2832365 RepID=UPI001CBB4934|nr:MaoC family dehydratase [Pseudomonas sp. BF-R-01]